jgi:hypothetical protein
MEERRSRLTQSAPHYLNHSGDVRLRASAEKKKRTPDACNVVLQAERVSLSFSTTEHVLEEIYKELESKFCSSHIHC